MKLILTQCDTKEFQKILAQRTFFFLDGENLDLYRPSLQEKYQFAVGAWHVSFNEKRQKSFFGKIRNELEMKKGLALSSFDAANDLPVFVSDESIPLDVHRDEAVLQVESLLPNLLTPENKGDFEFLSGYPLADHVRAFPVPLVYKKNVLDGLNHESKKITLILAKFFHDIFIGNQEIIKAGNFTEEEFIHLWGHISHIRYETVKNIWKNKSLDHIFYNTALDLMQAKDGLFYLIEVNSNSAMNPGGMADHTRFQNQFLDKFGDSSLKISSENELSAALVKSFLFERGVDSSDERVVLIYDEEIEDLNETNDMQSLESLFQLEGLRKLGIKMVKKSDLKFVSQMEEFLLKEYKYIINTALLSDSSATLLVKYFSENQDVHLMFPPGISSLDHKALLHYLEDFSHFYGVEINSDILKIPTTFLCTKDNLRRHIDHGLVVKNSKGAKGEGVFMPNPHLSLNSRTFAEYYFKNIIHKESRVCEEGACYQNFAVIAQEKVDTLRVKFDSQSFEEYTPVLRNFPWANQEKTSSWPFLFGRIGASGFSDKINVHGGALELLILSDDLLMN